MFRSGQTQHDDENTPNRTLRLGFESALYWLDKLFRRDIREVGQHSSMLPQYLLFAALATALPLAILLSVQLWMVTAYTGGFDLSSFVSQYCHGVYRYRLLGRDLLLCLYHFLQAHVAERPYPLPRDPSGSFLLYGAFAISNGVYFAASNLLLLFFLWIRKAGLRDRELSLYFYYTLLVAMSMAVVTPYDQLAYLLLLIGILGTRSGSVVAGMSLVVISAAAGTLNRETEFLFASFLATMGLFSPRVVARRYWIYLAVDLVISVGLYVGVRIAIPGDVQVIQSMTYGGKWAPESLFVLMMLLVAGVAMAMRLYRDVRPVVVFLILSIPYLLAVLISGVFRELRLMVPILLCVLCIYTLLERTYASERSGSSDAEKGMGGDAINLRRK